MSEPFRKYAPITVTGLCLAALSYACWKATPSARSIDPQANYYSVLERKEAQLTRELAGANAGDDKIRRELAVTLWQNKKFAKASELFDTVISHDNPRTDGPYDAAYVSDALNLAGVCLDGCNLKKAVAVYERILKYDQAHLPASDPRIGRDQNNIGLAYFTFGNAQAEEKTRREFLAYSLSCYQAAEDIFRASAKTRPQLICSMQNEALAYSELGDSKTAIRIESDLDKNVEYSHFSHDIFRMLSQISDGQTQ